MAGEIKLNNVSIATEDAGVVSFSNAVVGGVPAGAIMSFAMSSPPLGWLACNGGVISQTDYSVLYSAIGSTWVTPWSNSESITTGDYRKNSSGVIYIATSTGTTSGTDIGDDVGVTWSLSNNFLVPDLRGEFLRGWDNGKGSDPNASTRVGGDNVGSYQKYAIKNHGHTANIYAGNGALAGMNNSPAYHQQGNTHFNLYNTGVSTTTFDITSENVSDEIRPRNMAVNYCIKY